MKPDYARRRRTAPHRTFPDSRVISPCISQNSPGSASRSHAVILFSIAAASCSVVMCHEFLGCLKVDTLGPQSVSPNTKCDSCVAKSNSSL